MPVNPELKSVVRLEARSGRYVERHRYGMRGTRGDDNRGSGFERGFEPAYNPREDTGDALVKGGIAEDAEENCVMLMTNAGEHSCRGRAASSGSLSHHPLSKAQIPPQGLVDARKLTASNCKRKVS